MFCYRFERRLLPEIILDKMDGRRNSIVIVVVHAANVDERRFSGNPILVENL
jgi:hypothetical protein